VRHLPRDVSLGCNRFCETPHARAAETRTGRRQESPYPGRVWSHKDYPLNEVGIVGHVKSVPERIQRLQISHFIKADPAYGRGVAEGLGLKVEEPELVGAK
jgi:catalase